MRTILIFMALLFLGTSFSLAIGRGKEYSIRLEKESIGVTEQSFTFSVFKNPHIHSDTIVAWPKTNECSIKISRRRVEIVSDLPSLVMGQINMPLSVLPRSASIVQCSDRELVHVMYSGVCPDKNASGEIRIGIDVTICKSAFSALDGNDMYLNILFNFQTTELNLTTSCQIDGNDGDLPAWNTLIENLSSGTNSITDKPDNKTKQKTKVTNKKPQLKK